MSTTGLSIEAITTNGWCCSLQLQEIYHIRKATKPNVTYNIPKGIMIAARARYVKITQFGSRIGCHALMVCVWMGVSAGRLVCSERGRSSSPSWVLVVAEETFSMMPFVYCSVPSVRLWFNQINNRVIGSMIQVFVVSTLLECTINVLPNLKSFSKTSINEPLFASFHIPYPVLLRL